MNEPDVIESLIVAERTATVRTLEQTIRTLAGGTDG